MPITATFDNLEFNNVSGYLISMCMTPNQGFQGHFYVYLWDVADPQFKVQPIDIHEDGPTPRGTLQIVGDQRSYKFENIDMTVTEAGMTRRERFRLVEFRYAPDISDKVKLPAELENTSGVSLAQSGFVDDYKYNLGDGGEDLLGFRARLSARDAILMRFTSLRNTTNSWVKKIVEVNDEQVTKTGTERHMPEFDIALGFCPDKLKVTKDNVVRIFVQEAYGEALKWSYPSLTDLISNNAGPEKARINPESFLPEVLMRHEQDTGFTPAADSRTVETATFLFKAGQYRNLPIC